MTLIVQCPICKSKKAIRNKRKFFRCCGCLHTVKDSVLGRGVRRYELTRKVPISRVLKQKEEWVEVVE